MPRGGKGTQCSHEAISPKRPSASAGHHSHYLDVPPTKNFYVQSIRHIVIFRKTYFGSPSTQSLKILATRASLVLSVKRTG